MDQFLMTQSALFVYFLVYETPISLKILDKLIKKHFHNHFIRNSNKREKVSKIYSKQEDGRVSEECNNIGRNKVAQRHAASTWDELNLGITVTPIFPAESGDRVTVQVPMFDETSNVKLLKPIDNLYALGSELKEIADIISRVRNAI